MDREIQVYFDSSRAFETTDCTSLFLYSRIERGFITENHIVLYLLVTRNMATAFLPVLNGILLEVELTETHSR